MTKRVSKREEMRARAIVQRARGQERERERAAKRKLIGRCFKYPNGYSDGERWWLYAVVTGVDDSGRLSAIQFQVTANGQRSIEPDSYLGVLPEGGWQPITVGEFRAGTFDFMSAVCQALGQAANAAAVDPHAGSTGKTPTRV